MIELKDIQHSFSVCGDSLTNAVNFYLKHNGIEPIELVFCGDARIRIVRDGDVIDSIEVLQCLDAKHDDNDSRLAAAINDILKSAFVTGVSDSDLLEWIDTKSHAGWRWKDGLPRRCKDHDHAGRSFRDCCLNEMYEEKCNAM